MNCYFACSCMSNLSKLYRNHNAERNLYMLSDVSFNKTSEAFALFSSGKIHILFVISSIEGDKCEVQGKIPCTPTLLPSKASLHSCTMHTIFLYNIVFSGAMPYRIMINVHNCTTQRRSSGYNCVAFFPLL